MTLFTILLSLAYAQDAAPEAPADESATQDATEAPEDEATEEGEATEGDASEEGAEEGEASEGDAEGDDAEEGDAEGDDDSAAEETAEASPDDFVFETPMKSLMGPEGIVILKDGTEVKGKPLVIPKGVGNIKQVTIKTDDGKQKFKPTDVDGFALKPNKLAKLSSTKTSLRSSGQNKNVWSKEYAYFVPAPLKNGKIALLQHLNRGFDQTIQIFADPLGRETSGVGVAGVQITGGMLKAYLFYKKGADASIVVKKGNYDKLWDQLYGDCPAMTQPEKIEWDDLSKHVAEHGQKCGK